VSRREAPPQLDGIDGALAWIEKVEEKEEEA